MSVFGEIFERNFPDQDLEELASVALKAFCKIARDNLTVANEKCPTGNSDLQKWFTDDK
ncbi:unnamed protein product, partial [Amoebophrya sp. A25]|eukprot:GSA25T00026294001.1